MTTYLLILIVALQLADIATTYFALTRGKGVEANGILAKLFAKIGLLPGLVLIKGAFVALLWFAAPHAPVEVLYGVIVLYGWVCFNNLKVLTTR